jgi:hypothetical protein
VRIERCRFENIRVDDRNRGTIGLSSGSGSQRPHRIRDLLIDGCLFRNIDGSAINIRGNISRARIVNNHFVDIENRRSASESPLGGYAIRLGESSDDAGLLEVFAPQGHHRIEGNVIRGMRKETVHGNLIGMLLYGNHTQVRNNLIEEIDGTETGEDVNAIYVRGSYNRIEDNTIRGIHGADDDGAVCFKGGLDLGSTGNVVSGNTIADIRGMSAIEASTSNLRVSRNEIRNAPVRGVRHRGGENLLMTENVFQNANADIRTESGQVVIAGNRFIDSIIWISQRRSHPARREGTFITGNIFEGEGASVERVIRLANRVEERFVSIRNNRFESRGQETEARTLADLVSSGSLQQVEIYGNRVGREEASSANFRTRSATLD